MRILSKINRGVILTVVVLVGVAGYLIGLEAMHSSARKEIQQICEKYVAAELQYYMLPQAYRTESPQISEQELERYMTAMRDELKGFFVDNEQTYRYKLKELEENLTAQSKGEGVVYEYKKEIVRYKIEFDGNTASVTLTSTTTYDGPVSSYSSKTGASSRQTLTGEVTDRLSLQRVNGEWKLTYAALYLPDAGGVRVSYGY